MEEVWSDEEEGEGGLTRAQARSQAISSSKGTSITTSHPRVISPTANQSATTEELIRREFNALMQGRSLAALQKQVKGAASLALEEDPEEGGSLYWGDNMELQGKKDLKCLRFGDCISIFHKADEGFLSGVGVINGNVSLARGTKKSPPRHFRDSVFQVLPQKQYHCQKALNALLRKYGYNKFHEVPRKSLSPHMWSKLVAANEKAEAEIQENRLESRRSMGCVVTYGSSVQLLHIRSGKVLIVMREASQVDSMSSQIKLAEDTDSSVVSASFFKLLPGTKLFAEGEKIHFKDQVIFQSSKFLLNLHTSPTSAFTHSDRLRSLSFLGEAEGSVPVAFEESQTSPFEVNASPLSHRWRVYMYDRPSWGTSGKHFLRVGEAIHFFHKELGGWLSNDHLHEHRDERRQRHPLTAKSKESVCLHCSNAENVSSSNFMWEVEGRDTTVGGVCAFRNRSYRLIHIASGKFLCCKPSLSPNPGDRVLTLTLSEEGGPDTDSPSESPFHIFLSDDADDEDCLFRLHSMFGQEESRITFDDYVRIQHKSTGCWLNTSSSAKAEFSGRENEIPQSGTLDFRKTVESRVPLKLSLQSVDEDAFTVSPVAESMQADLQFVIRNHLFLYTFLRQMLSGQHQDLSVLDLVQESLTSLILFCSASEEMDPLKREGIAYQSRQKLLRERGVIDFAVNMAKALINRPLGIAKSDPDFVRILQLIFRFLKQACKDYPKNRLFLGKHLEFLESQLGMEYKVADTLMETFKNNIRLLCALKHRSLQFYVDLPRTKGLYPRFFRFLCSLVSCDHPELGRIGIGRNQKIVFKQLCSRCPEVLAKFSVHPSSGDLMIDYPTDNQGGRVQCPMLTFLRQEARNPLLIQYLCCQVELFACLCLNRPRKIIASLSEQMPLNVVKVALQLEGLPDEWKKGFARVLQHLHATVLPSTSLVDHVILWQSLDCEAKESMESLSKRLLQECDQTAALMEEDAVSSGTGMTGFDDSDSASTMSDLTTGTDSASIHMLAKTEELPGIVNFVLNLLECHQSQDYTLPERNYFLLSLLESIRSILEQGMIKNLDHLKHIVFVCTGVLDGRLDDYSNAPSTRTRFSETEKNLPIVLCKREIVRIFDILLDIRLSRRVTTFLKSFKDHPGQCVNLHQLIEETDFLCLHSSVGNLDQLFLDLCQYENYDLRSAAFHFLFRTHRQAKFFLDHMEHVQILVSADSVTLYQQLKNMVEQVSSLSMLTMLSSRQENDLCSVVEELCDQCNEALRRSPAELRQVQTLLRGLGLLKKLVTLLGLPPADHSFRDELFTWIYYLLRLFVFQNHENQIAAFEHLELYLSHMGGTYNVAKTIQCIIENNLVVCASLQDSHFRHFARCIVERGSLPRFLDIFKAAIHCNGLSLDKNQSMAMQALCESQSEALLLLFKGREGRARKAELMARLDHVQHPEFSPLAYHLALLNVLTLCTSGKNYGVCCTQCASIHVVVLLYLVVAPCPSTTLFTISSFWLLAIH